MARRKKGKDFVIDPDDHGYEEEIEENGFIDFDDNQPIRPNEVLVSSFNFFDNTSENANSANTDNNLSDPIVKPQINELHKNKDSTASTNNFKESLTDIRTTKQFTNGVTPPVDGELFTIKRTYTLRKSTVKMLNHIKALDDDINVYMNTLVDAAIRHYYEHILNKLNNA
ncbi:hypothetical protein JHL18_25045 [Clostridium sp. YIM B02505]|uniref:Uncharacterized protein n=1 Tax=Clostridium yunnanense TaxID=2800325 RepID=A0ABS1EWX3_9CLOT|nr:hypothetical protein [Clostridium yunnanense]MBK1813877.1 hypothetical protein [Clostridium yunnanense]